VVKVLSVVELPFVPTSETWALPESYYSQLEQAGRQQANAAIERAVEQLHAGQGPAFEIVTTVAHGQAKEMILSEADEWDADLIVLGSHGLKGWERFLLGSVSQAVASHAKCSVEIVRGRQARESERK
jgi:nucleotide-binding universal stress UspA family protein